MADSSTAPLLIDPWARRGVPLDGWLERHRFAPLWMALGVLVVGFVLFQVVGSIVTLGLVLAQGVPMERFASDAAAVLAAHPRAALLGNTVGQVLGLGVPVLLLARLHARRALAFLRLRRPDAALAALSFVGLAALWPVVAWLGELNQLIPMPDWVYAIEEPQTQLLDGVIASDVGLAFLVVMIALTPAICEELMFRGYVQRQFERRLGAAWSVALTGVLFGLYHLRLTQALPLIALGVYLAYVTWRTGSLWPAVLLHLAYNACSIVLARAAGGGVDVQRLNEVETMQLPWYIVAPSLVAFAAVVAVMQRLAPARRPPVSPAQAGGKNVEKPAVS